MYNDDALLGPIYFFAIIFTFGIMAATFVVGSTDATEKTLVLCNEQPKVCKLKYNNLVYDQQGKLPINKEEVK
jgi:hypothetical protein